jgi:hypothetical protein
MIKTAITTAKTHLPSFVYFYLAGQSPYCQTLLAIA